MKDLLYICDMETKVCFKCGEEKPMTTEYFYANKTAKSGLNSACKICYRNRSSERSRKIYSGIITTEKKVIEKKVCRSCKIEKPISNFGKKIENKDGFRNECKTCRLEYEKKWILENPEKNKNIKKRHNKKISKDPHKSFASRVRKNIQMAFKVYTTNGKKWIGKTTEEILGCDIDFFAEYISSKFQEGMSLENHGQYGWHLDHIIPLASATTEEEIYKLNHHTNFQPLWWQENLSKGDKLPAEWMSSNTSN
jgi:hypothetical protein